MDVVKDMEMQMVEGGVVERGLEMGLSQQEIGVVITMDEVIQTLTISYQLEDYPKIHRVLDY